MCNPRVLLLNWRDMANPLAGGAEVHIWEVFRRLAAQGWNVSAICASHKGLLPWETVDGIEVHRCGGPYGYYFALPWVYRRVSKESPPHFVIDFMNKLPLFSPLYVREPVICFVHHLFGSAASLDAGRLAGLTVGSFERFVRPVYARTPCLAGSASTLRELESIGLPRENLAAVPYGVHTSFYGPGQKSLQPNILYVGRLKRYKGITDLIEVVPRLLESFPGLCVKIAGQGGLEAGLRALIARLRLEKCVELCGFVSEEAKRTLYQEAWTACFPSAKEGFGLTVPEAALCGTPTVGYDVPGLNDAIQDGETGLLVPFGDKTGLYEALRRMLADAELRARLSQNAQQVYSSFSWDSAAEQTKEAIFSILQHRWPHLLDALSTGAGRVEGRTREYS